MKDVRPTRPSSGTERPEVLLLCGRDSSAAHARERLRGISRYVVEHRSFTLWVEPQPLTRDASRWLQDWTGAGLIVEGTTAALAEMTRTKRWPAVAVDDAHPSFGLPQVLPDNAAIGRLVAKHLHDQGLTRFAAFGAASEPWSESRIAGFQDALSKYDAVADVHEAHGHGELAPSWSDAQAALVGWLRSLPLPIGLFAVSDSHAQRVVAACRRARLHVPSEVSVVGVDNDESLCEACDPPLSSVLVDHERVGYTAAQVLDRLLRGEQVLARHVIPPIGVMARASSHRLAGSDALLHRALEIIRAQACRGLTVSKLALLTGASRSVLERKLRRVLGSSPQSLIRGARIDEAKRLLLHTDLAIHEIADRVGFRHREYLTVVFRRETGSTPERYRRAVRANHSA